MTKPKKARPAPSAPDEETLKLSNQICFPLYAASRMIVNAYRPLLSVLGVTYPQYLVMLVLWEEDGLNVSTIGERLHLDSGTVTPVLKRMELQGLIVRRRMERDDRIVNNWLTPEGRALKKRAAKVPGQLLCDAKLSMEELPPMRAACDRLIEALLPLQPEAMR